MMRSVSAVLVAAVVGLAGSVSSAHHSYAATYNTSKDIKLEGKLVQFVYRNPHTFVHVEAPDASGKVERWAVEWSGTSQLAGAGVSRDTLKIGDAVVVTIHPSRVASEHRGLMMKLVRPSDGFNWGSTGQTVD
jgi:hypothetical protein